MSLTRFLNSTIASSTPLKNRIGNTPCPIAKKHQYATYAPTVPHKFAVGGYGKTVWLGQSVGLKLPKASSRNAHDASARARSVLRKTFVRSIIETSLVSCVPKPSMPTLGLIQYIYLHDRHFRNRQDEHLCDSHPALDRELF